MRRFVAAAFAGFALAAPAQEVSPEIARALRAYSEFRTHALAAWHPARREMLVLTSVRGAPVVHTLAEPGARLQPLPATTGAADATYHSARGDSFVFIAPGPDGLARVQRYDASTQSAAMVSPAGERAIDFAWSPSGDRIVYATASADGARSTLRTVDPLRPATEKVLGRHDGKWSDLRYATNGRRVVATQYLAGGESHLWQVAIPAGTTRRITRPDGKTRASYGSPQFTRDGNSILALARRGTELRHLVLLPIAGGKERILTAHLKHSVDAFAVSSDAGLAALVTHENGAHVMRFIDLVTLKEQPRPPLLDGAIGGLAWRPGSREVGFHISSARTAGDVFSYDVKSNQVTRWTNGNNPAVNARELPEPRIVRWKAAEGRDATALLYAPPARFPGKRPAIVDHRAAPHQVRAGFLGEANYLVNDLGIAIVRPDARGPRDIESLLQWIGSQPGLDAARTIVIGEGGDAAIDEETFMRASMDFARRAGS